MCHQILPPFSQRHSWSHFLLASHYFEGSGGGGGRSLQRVFTHCGAWVTRCGAGREGSGRKENGGGGKRKLGGGNACQEGDRG